eukprot:COSAG02_NODE_47191_length_343_cov_0.618852_1_plen_32_part_10
MLQLDDQRGAEQAISTELAMGSGATRAVRLLS